MKLYMVYYYDTDISDSENSELFVADEKRNVETQFVAYRNMQIGEKHFNRNNISDCFEVRGATDNRNRDYIVTIRRKEKGVKHEKISS